MLVIVLMVWKIVLYCGFNLDVKLLIEFKVLKNKDVLLVLFMGVIGFGGMFLVYFYFSVFYFNIILLFEWGILVILFIYGIGVILGNIIVGCYFEGRLLMLVIMF